MSAKFISDHNSVSTPAPDPKVTTTPNPTQNIKPTFAPSTPNLSPTPKPVFQSPTAIPTPFPMKYDINAVWIGEANDPIDTNLQNVITTLVKNQIKFAIIITGYWNATTPSEPTINYDRAPEIDASICAAFKAAGIAPIAWVESIFGTGTTEGIPNITSTYYSVYNAQIGEVMARGFSGYSEDIEQYSGTGIDYINYHNQQAIYLHSIGKICMPAIPANTGGNNYNSFLNVDYILTMFYWTTSLFENPDSDIYWQEEFGLGNYNSTFGTPASPIIFGINGSQENQNSFSWQLSQFARCLNNYGSSNLAGICIWSYDFMNSADWTTWNNWNQI